MKSLGPYEGLIVVSAALGGGGDTTVYKGRESATGQTVALKVLSEKKTEPISVERFRQEASLLAGLDHPHIVKVLATPVLTATEPPCFYVMQFIEGESLAAKLQKIGGSMPLSQFAPIFGQLAQALAYIHAKGIVHMDVKPNNVILSADNSITLIDFGISRLVGGNQNWPRRSGTLAYASPEQVLGMEYSHQSDIFSLAALSYEVLSGSHPFSSLTTCSISTITDEILRGKEKPLHLLSSDIPMAISVCLARALSKDPKQRYADILSFAQDFEHCAKSKS